MLQLRTSTYYYLSKKLLTLSATLRSTLSLILLLHLINSRLQKGINRRQPLLYSLGYLRHQLYYLVYAMRQRPFRTTLTMYFTTSLTAPTLPTQITCLSTQQIRKTTKSTFKKLSNGLQILDSRLTSISISLKRQRLSTLALS